MIKEFVDAWDKNKGSLEEYFRTHNQYNYDSYQKLVELLFNIVINPSVTLFDTKDILVIDDGDYQGTEIYILHRNTYQPCILDYVYTHTYYGSCSCCDTLLSIHGYDVRELPTDAQIHDYMDLCLHLLQRCTYMIEGGE